MPREHDAASLDEIRAVTDAVERLRLAEARLGRQRAGHSGLNDTDRAAVRYVSEFPGDAVTPRMIADQLHLSPSSVTTLLDRLVAKHLLRVEPHPVDRRSKHVVALDRTAALDDIDPLGARLREISASLTTSEASIITGFLERVTEAVRSQTPRFHGLEG
ncbi:MarR family winged helix-turn-helix transcriptional regulator [Microbacterium rhizosphaerae]|uniref:MarR family transcriptional regulator n=1 Tax=Microbacterium rhizosphaerae TaxID=1678237 RepID=A0ABZ0SJ49_9MICO|nr:MarR family transcriptional regulator [Microbacterium rhizosphaerae]WPR88500.1 MarR family transcriptional regulator [Microbacterium rhizosphaerae]